MGALLLAFLAIAPTPPPAGPYRVDGGRIVDRHGRPYLIRGTEAPPEAWTAATLVTIRQRLNMNAVRIPAAGRNPARVAAAIRIANQLELLAIVEEDDPPAVVRDNPDALVAVSNQRALERLRAAGYKRPVITRGFPTEDADTIREFTLGYTDPLPDAPGPMLVNGLDPMLDRDSPECRAFPSDPGAASRLVREKLTALDARDISWTISSFRPGRLITDYRYLIGTKLDDGWTCGGNTAAGLGMLLLSHLWKLDPHGLFAVNGDAGNYLLPIGGRATVYGPTLADAERYAPPGPLPARLGNLTVRITDSRGVARLAPLLYAAAGWAHINFIVPPGCAPGPAELAVVRSDGTKSITQTLLQRVAPGLAGAYFDGRGIAKAWTAAGAPAWTCHAADCDAVPIPAGSVARFEGTGFRAARAIHVMVGDTEARVAAFGPMPGVPGKDQISVEIPPGASGEADVLLRADGVLSNVVRIRTVAPRLPNTVHGDSATRR